MLWLLEGSVIPLFINQIFENKPITITDPKMTRFMMTLDEAVDLVLFAFENGASGDIFVQKAPAATVENLARTLSSILGFKEYPIKTIGTRHGEKIHETLLSREELVFSKDLGNYFKVPIDRRDLNYDLFFEKGDSKITLSEDYNSGNTERLSNSELKKLLFKLPFMKDISEGKSFPNPRVNILLTGSDGFIGKNLKFKLLENKHSVIEFTRGMSFKEKFSQ